MSKNPKSAPQSVTQSEHKARAMSEDQDTNYTKNPSCPDDTSKRIILDYFAKTYPNPECFLHHTTPYTLLIGVLLSAQSTDQAVNLVMPSLIRVADSPEKMIILGLDGLKPLIATIGLHQRKGQYIIQLSQLLIDRHQAEVPDTLAALTALPGVGRKTANVVLNVLFGLPTIPVDTHVERVSKRLGWVQDQRANPLKIETILDSMIALPWKKHIHAWLILHGRNVCKARSPACKSCPISHTCGFFQHNQP